MPILNALHLVDAHQRASWSPVLLLPHAEFTPASRNAVDLSPTADWIYDVHFGPYVSDTRKSVYEYELQEFGCTRVALSEIGWAAQRPD